MTTEVSAGGVVYKSEDGKTLWLVVMHSGYHKWVFPKGRQEKGEELEATALREVREEAGIVVKTINKIPEPESYVYSFNGESIDKTVQYYLMEYVSGDIADHDWETENIKWVAYDQAQAMLGFPGAKKTLAVAQKLLPQ